MKCPTVFKDYAISAADRELVSQVLSLSTCKREIFKIQIMVRALSPSSFVELYSFILLFSHESRASSLIIMNSVFSPLHINDDRGGRRVLIFVV